MTKTLYNKIWETCGKKVGYGSACDDFTNEIVKVLNESLPDYKNNNKYDLDYESGWNDCVDFIKMSVMK